MSFKRTSPQPVVEGGTGAITLTAGEVLLGQGTSAITTVATGAPDDVLTLDGGGNVVWATPSAPAVFTWNTVSSGTSTPMTSFNGYICTYAGQANLVLPTTSAVGDQIWILSDPRVTASRYQITWTTGQTIGKTAGTATVTTGTATSTQYGYGILIICIEANLVWALSASSNQTVNLTLT